MSRIALSAGLAAAAISAIWLVPRLASTHSVLPVPPAAQAEPDRPFEFSAYYDHQELTINLGTSSNGPRDMVVVVDTSGSMIASDLPSHSSKFDNAKAAIQSLIGHLSPEDRIAVVAFADDARLLRPLAPIDRDLDFALQTIQLGGGTNIAAGIERGMAAFDVSSHRQRQLVLLSDGKPNSGNTAPGAIPSLLEQAREDGVQVKAWGWGLAPAELQQAAFWDFVGDTSQLREAVVPPDALQVSITVTGDHPFVGSFPVNDGYAVALQGPGQYRIPIPSNETSLSLVVHARRGGTPLPPFSYLARPGTAPPIFQPGLSETSIPEVGGYEERQ